jgi:hypothetical protein
MIPGDHIMRVCQILQIGISACVHSVCVRLLYAILFLGRRICTWFLNKQLQKLLDSLLGK